MWQRIERIPVLCMPNLSKITSMLALMFIASAGLWAIGFLNMPAVHDALHDVRHSMGFPCH